MSRLVAAVAAVALVAVVVVAMNVASAVRDLSPAHAEGVVGDVNADGEIDSIDALHILQFSAGIISPDPDEDIRKAGDVNGDGLVDSVDASLILQFHSGRLTSL